jgi:hypothetical protein
LVAPAVKPVTMYFWVNSAIMMGTGADDAGDHEATPMDE